MVAAILKITNMRTKHYALKWKITKTLFKLLIPNIKIGHFKNVHFYKIDLTFYCKKTIVE